MVHVKSRLVGKDDVLSRSSSWFWLICMSFIVEYSGMNNRFECNELNDHEAITHFLLPNAQAPLQFVVTPLLCCGVTLHRHTQVPAVLRFLA